MFPRLTSTARRAALGALVAGVLWLLIWGHGQVAHGPTEVNRKQIWLGLTWMDSGKFLVLPFLLLIPGIIFIARRGQDGGSRLAPVFGGVVVAVLVAAVVFTALQFWTFEWGSYGETFESKGGVVQLGGLLQALTSSVILTIAFIIFGVAAARVRAMPYWLIAVLAIGSLTTIFLTPPLPIPGVAWLIFGGWLLSPSATRLSE